MEDKIQNFINQFSNETRELIIRISWCWEKGCSDFGMVDNYYKASVHFDKAIEVQSDTIIQPSIHSQLYWLYPKKLFGFKYGYKFKKNAIYRVVVREHIENTPEKAMKYYLERIIESDIKDARLEDFNINFKENRKEYAKVDGFEYNDEYFGKINFKSKDKILEYEGYLSNCEFDGEKIGVSINTSEDTELSTIMSNLKTFCKNSSEIKERIYIEFADYLKDYDTSDGNGNLINITESYLRENLSFSCIEINEYYIDDIANEVGILCSWEDSGSQDYIIKYDIAKNKLEFELL